ncbi:MAG: glycerate kinase [Ferrimicrobium sp.]
MNREVHVRFDGSGRGKIPPATLQGFRQILALELEPIEVVDGLGRPLLVPLGWRHGDAIVELADVVGLERAGGVANNRPVSSSTRGVGMMIAAALQREARSVMVGCGGSGTTDGGLGAVRFLRESGVISDGRSVQALVDVRTQFLDAARVFGPQKGATKSDIRLLTARLEAIARWYERRLGISVVSIPGSGSAGGTAGGLAAWGAEIVPGASTVARMSGLSQALESSDLLVTGEGRLDATSFAGKVVGELVTQARRSSVRVVAVVGDADDDGLREAARQRCEVFSLAKAYGPKGRSSVGRCLEEVAPLVCVSQGPRSW